VPVVTVIRAAAEVGAMLVSLTVEEVMSTPVATVAESASARTVAERLSTENIGALVVVDEDRPVGIVTESDLVDLVAEGADLDGETVATFASADPVTVGPEASVERAAEVLERGEFRRLPVVADDVADFVERLEVDVRRTARHIELIRQLGHRHTLLILECFNYFERPVDRL